MFELIKYISSDLLSPLFKKLVAIRNTRKREITAISDVFGDTELLSKYYVEPRCQSVNPADFDEDDPIAYVTEPAFATVNRFLNREFKITGDGRNQMFILGDAGMGKTSLLVMLKLFHITNFWPNSYNCALHKIGKNTLDTIERIEDKANTVLLLDALDEDPLAWEAISPRLVSLLTASRYFRRVLIACRTQFFPIVAHTKLGAPERVEIGGFKCPVVFMSLFEESQVAEYLEKRFPLAVYGDAAAVKILQAKAVLAAAASLTLRPLLLSHVEDLLDSAVPITNEYTCYQELIWIWLRREERKLREVRQDTTVDTSVLWGACVEIALEMQHRMVRSLSEEQFSFVMRYHPNLKWFNAFEVSGRSLLNRNSEGAYRFSHYTIQEFLVADAILKGRAASGTQRLQVTGKILDFISAKRRMDVPQEGTPKGYQLAGVDFSKCRFSGVPLIGANLRKATLRDCEFVDVKLSSSVLDAASAEGAEFNRCIFSMTSLREASLSRAVFRDSSLNEVTLQNADLTLSDFGATVFEGVDFRQSKLADADMSRAKCVKSNMQEADLRSAKLKGIRLVDCNLMSANMSAVNLTGCDFSGCDLTGARLSGATLVMAKFEKAVLRSANLDKANAQQANFRQANLTGASHKDADFTGAEFDKASLDKGWAVTRKS